MGGMDWGVWTLVGGNGRGVMDFFMGEWTGGFGKKCGGNGLFRGEMDWEGLILIVGEWMSPDS